MTDYDKLVDDFFKPVMINRRVAGPISYVLALFLVFLFFPAFALGGKGDKGNGAPHGSHYNLNIIGVPEDKTAVMK